MSLDKTSLRLLHSRIWHQSEAQSRQILQRGLEVLQQAHSQLVTKYQSAYEEQDVEIARLREDLGIAEGLAGTQKQLLDMYQGQQQQPPASQPLLPQYDHHHSNQYPQYPPYEQSSSHQFVMDPATLPRLNDFRYSIGAPIEPSCDTDPVMSTPFPQFEETPNLFMQPPTSAERDVPGPTNTKSEGTKRGPEDEGVKPSKKRKAK
jgi:hypothetical protein